MKIKDWLFDHKNIQDADIILAEILGKDRTFLITHEDQELETKELEEAEHMARERGSGKPLAYILGYTYFYGRKFFVPNGKALIPRPETEDAIDLIKELKPKRVLDVGTGSGCIGITLAFEIPGAEIFVSDIHDHISDLVSENLNEISKHEKLQSKISFIKSDLLRDINQKFDVIVANLPYVDKKWEWLNEHDLSFEPDDALYADDGGLKLIKELIDQTKEKQAAKYLVLEADPCQHKDIASYAQNHGFKHIKTRGFILVFELV